MKRGTGMKSSQLGWVASVLLVLTLGRRRLHRRRRTAGRQCR